MDEKSYFGEGKNVEFKREIPQRHERFLKDIIAFANCTGGKVILGIEDQTNMVCGIGDANPFRLSDDITNMIADACTPQIETDITLRTLEGKTVLVVEVLPGRFRPYYLKSVGKQNSAYVRMNGTSRPADRWRLQELELEGQRIYYDMLPEIGMDYDESEALKLCHTMYEAALSACRTQEERENVQEMTIEKLENMGLLLASGHEYSPTHAFRLMTSNGIRYAKIQCALFKGTERDIFIDRKEFTGPIYQQVEDAYQFLCRHTNLGAEINGIIRRDIYELPVRAIREAIINAIGHRSYLEDSCVQLSIYDDRVDVFSPGGLYGGLDLASALNGKSKCRNAAVSEAFHYMKLMETWGTGLKRIQNSCKEYGLPEPLIEEDGYGFRVTFNRKKIGVAEKQNSATESVIEKQDSATESVAEKRNSNTEKIKKGDIENCLIEILLQFPTITQQEVAEQLGYSKTWIRRVMKKMQENGILYREGSSKKGKWIVKTCKTC